MRILIVGGSVVGASAALFLAARGLTPVLVEKHLTVSTRLRAKIFYPRSMEAYRAVGADRDIYAVQHSRPPADHAAVVRSLAGPELRRWLLPAAADFTDVTPSPSVLVKQADLEEVVRAQASAAGADLRFGHRLLGLRDHGDRVVARIAGPDGSEYFVEADYVLAADGNASGIRESLGIGRTGRETVSHVMEISFRADLRPLLDGRRLALAWTAEPERAFLSWNTGLDRGAVSVTYDPAGAQFPDRRCETIVARALGLPPSRFTVDGRRPWQMSGWVADAYRKGRVFLLGDAAHVTPPTGGFGANAGIQDAWNLTTKLVSIARGDASPRLLDDYEPERRSVGRLTVDQALLRVEGEHTPLSEAAVAIGYRYPAAGEHPAPADADEPARWRGQPGTRLPHHWLPDGTSTLDLLREGRYVLFAAPSAAVRTPNPQTTVLPLPECLADCGTMLVRPDHVIAARTADAPADT